jgi:hypothetical protein
MRKTKQNYTSIKAEATVERQQVLFNRYDFGFQIQIAELWVITIIMI